MAEASPLADSPPQSSATDRRASAPPADFDPEESDWFAEGDTLAEQPTLAWEEADVCSRPRIAAVRQSKGPETAERRYKLSWASAWVED